MNDRAVWMAAVRREKKTTVGRRPAPEPPPVDGPETETLQAGERELARPILGHSDGLSTGANRVEGMWVTVRTQSALMATVSRPDPPSTFFQTVVEGPTGAPS